MKITTSYADGTLSLSFIGELDHHGAKGALRSIDDIIDEYLPSECAINFSKLKFMDSSGIALILRVYKRMSEMGGSVRVENPAGQPLRVLHASGVNKVVQIVN